MLSTVIWGGMALGLFLLVILFMVTQCCKAFCLEWFQEAPDEVHHSFLEEDEGDGVEQLVTERAERQRRTLRSQGVWTIPVHGVPHNFRAIASRIPPSCAGPSADCSGCSVHGLNTHSCHHSGPMEIRFPAHLAIDIPPPSYESLFPMH